MSFFQFWRCRLYWSVYIAKTRICSVVKMQPLTKHAFPVCSFHEKAFLEKLHFFFKANTIHENWNTHLRFTKPAQKLKISQWFTFKKCLESLGVAIAKSLISVVVSWVFAGVLVHSWYHIHGFLLSFLKVWWTSSASNQTFFCWRKKVLSQSTSVQQCYWWVN